VTGPEAARAAATRPEVAGPEASAAAGRNGAAFATPFLEWLQSDPEVLGLLEEEAIRQSTTLQLIASENFTSPAVLAASGSVLTNKYAEGYPGRRYYGGNRVIDEVEELARERAKALFRAEHANVQPHAGASANLAVYQALLDPGDTVLAMRLDQGGHLTHGSPASITSKIWRFVSYGVTPASDDSRNPGEVIDFDQLAEVAKRERPRLIVAGATAYPRVIEPEPFREVADAVGAYLMFDSAHPAGLIAGGVHPSPVELADVVTLTTHKTLRGPRGGAILSKAEHAKAIDSAVFPGLQGGPLEHVVAAKAVAFAEASTPAFRDYAARVVSNAKALAEALGREGFRLVSGGTDNHLVLVDLRSFDPDLTGKEAQEVLDRVGITLNRNQIPDDPRPPFTTSGLRLGSAAETTAGMGPGEMRQIAGLIGKALRGRGDARALGEVRDEVAELCGAFPPYAAFVRSASSSSVKTSSAGGRDRSSSLAESTG
jgi:glycine hydroxymethyltransferase